MSKLSKRTQDRLTKYLFKNYNPANLKFEKVRLLVAKGHFDDFLDYLPPEFQEAA